MLVLLSIKSLHQVDLNYASLFSVHIYWGDVRPKLTAQNVVNARLSVLLSLPI